VLPSVLPSAAAAATRLGSCPPPARDTDAIPSTGGSASALGCGASLCRAAQEGGATHVLQSGRAQARQGAA
jgi:hypothetical protein